MRSALKAQQHGASTAGREQVTGLLRPGLSRVLGAVAVGALLLGSAAPALAADGDASFEASLEVTKTDESKTPTERVLVYKGKFADAPVGTRIDIRFKLKENLQHINWYYGLTGKSQTINGRSAPLTRPFGAGVYEVEFWFKMNTQNRKVKKWFRTNRGYTNRHAEVLETVRISVGSPSEQDAFVEKTLETMRDYFGTLRKIYSDARAHFDAGKDGKDAAWKPIYDKHKQTILDMQRSFYNWKREWVALPVETYRTRLEQLVDADLKLLEFIQQSVPRQTTATRVKQIEEQVEYLENALSPEVQLQPSDGKKSGGGGMQDAGDGSKAVPVPKGPDKKG